MSRETFLGLLADSIVVGQRLGSRWRQLRQRFVQGYQGDGYYHHQRRFCQSERHRR